LRLRLPTQPSRPCRGTKSRTVVVTVPARGRCEELLCNVEHNRHIPPPHTCRVPASQVTRAPRIFSAYVWCRVHFSLYMRYNGIVEIYLWGKNTFLFLSYVCELTRDVKHSFCLFVPRTNTEIKDSFGSLKLVVYFCISSYRD